MTADSDRARQMWLLLPRSVRRLPADLAAVLGVVALTCLAVLTPGIRQTPLRILVGLPFVLFVPGYAFIAALFPEASDTATDQTDANATTDSVRRGTGSIDGIERVALSFGTSIAIVPLLGLGLNFTPWGIRLVPVLLTVSGFTLIATVCAASRRWALPPAERFRVPYTAWLATVRTEFTAPESRTDLALNALLVMSVLLAAASVTYAVAVPKQGEAFTEFYLLTENETGELVADDYPTEFTPGESKPVHVGIGNHEHRPLNYTVVIAIQKVSRANNTTQVQATRELQRLHASVGTNQTWLRDVNITPTLRGERLRLVFLLYRGAPPAQPSVDTAYRELHLWVNVTETHQSTVGPRTSPPPTGLASMGTAGPNCKMIGSVC